MLLLISTLHSAVCDKTMLLWWLPLVFCINLVSRYGLVFGIRRICVGGGWLEIGWDSIGAWMSPPPHADLRTVGKFKSAAIFYLLSAALSAAFLVCMPDFNSPRSGLSCMLTLPPLSKAFLCETLPVLAPALHRLSPKQPDKDTGTTVGRTGSMW